MSSYPFLTTSVSLLNSSYQEVDIYRLDDKPETIVVEVKPDYGFKFVYLCDGIGEADDVAYEVRRFIYRGRRYQGQLVCTSFYEEILFDEVSPTIYQLTYNDEKCTFQFRVRGFYNAQYVRDSFAILLSNLDLTLPF